jgi:hypothetical protein
VHAIKRGGREAAEKLVAEGIDARSVRLDVTDSESIAAAARRIGQEFGGRLDVLVNNAADPGYTATDLNGHSGPRTVEEGARIAVHLATLPSDGTTGGFFKLKLSGAIFRNIAMGGIETVCRMSHAPLPWLVWFPADSQARSRTGQFAPDFPLHSLATRLELLQPISLGIGRSRIVESSVSPLGLKGFEPFTKGL